ncbi:hypothetical protein HMPREF3221_01102 [Fusobacterium nucleatum]|uniref:Uncharacterized protein n=1 Tax=Fusobacterium nucleatum TaxID=851 RepID=A0A133NZC2_FUSNU|nr:hypothetical protein HMPREF3221_01102 [Fusobacterium nucleatum]
MLRFAWLTCFNFLSKTYIHNSLIFSFRFKNLIYNNFLFI